MVISPPYLTSQSKVAPSTEPGYPACFSYTYTDIGSTILGCTTSYTAIAVQNVANTPSITTTTSASSSVVSEGRESLPVWVTNTFSTFLNPSSPAAGPVTLGSFSSSGTQTASNAAPDHLGTVAAAVAGGVAGLVLLAGVALYFCLRKKDVEVVPVREPEVVMDRTERQPLRPNMRGYSPYPGT